MSENKFWLGFNFILVAGVCVITALATNYWKDHNSKVVGLIKQGVPAIEVMCAMQDDYGKNPVCIVLAARK